ncbi:disease resistance protein RPM1 [Vigna unguiculata]|uniref:Disease resistance protein RPM1 n=1 Tax=Vigna unguiculata TaxID=3917 RepID=A0A4D6LQ72_VIGUN|nr:disease resistance protein RPM1 [Vigna unguiculata]
MGTIKHPHMLPELSVYYCWELFKHQAFGADEIEQEELVMIGRKIVRKCGGVPLAAKALGDGRLDAEDVGDDAWNELYRRSLFQDIEVDEFGKVTSFKMHDLVHDLAQFVADEEVCCITDEDYAPVLFERKRIQHLSDYRWWLHSTQLHQVKSLRTYIKSKATKELSSDVLKCYSLRLLHISLREELSASIVDLKHLKYLNLSCSDFKTLPESLCKLLNLKILKLDYCQRLQKLPDSLVRLKALQQLSLKVCRSLSRLPPYIGKLNSLRSLSMYFVGEQKGFLLAELGLLKLKRDLEIKHLERVKNITDAKESNMSSKKLNNLMLRWSIVREGELEGNDEEVLEALQPCTETLQSLRVEGYQGVRFPPWMSTPFLKNLTSLELWCCTNCIKLPVLRNLRSLKRLEINQQYLSLRSLPSLIRLSSEDGENQFPSLSTLDIEDCPHFWLQGLPSLKRLTMRRNPKLKMCPGLECLPCLEDLTIDSCEEVEGLRFMTALKKLALINLINIKSLPECFGDLPLLRELRIFGCYKLMRLPTSLSLSRLETIMLRQFFLKEKESTIHSTQLHQVKSLRTYVDSRTTDELSYDVLRCYSLRVLHLSRWKELSSSIGDLKHLRYLNLSYGDFKTLPESLCKLLNLQILKLDYCYSLQKLPNSLERGFLLAELGQLKLKRNLDIKHLEKVKSGNDAKEINMSIKQLNKLTLTWGRFREGKLEGNDEEVLEALEPCTETLLSLRVEGYQGND